jgi:tripartite-type tricarboxylate transporter receptor subunit TctC
MDERPSNKRRSSIGGRATEEAVMRHRLRAYSAGVLTLSAVALLAAALPLGAQSYPTNPIHIVVAAGVGTPPDIISRIVANQIQETEGWRVIVENKVGAMQMLAGEDVLKQPADGYAIVSVSLPGMTAPSLLPNTKIRLERDFVPVVKLSTSYNVLVVHPSVPAHSVAELVALLKSRPDKMTYSSGGFGTPAHLAGELFKVKTGVRATHIPYQQFPQAIGDLLSGTNQFMFVTTLPVISLIETDRLRALAVTAPKRLAVLPNVPTVVEAGFPELVMQAWVGYLMRSGTPDAVVARMNKAVNDALATPKVRDAMARLGAEPAGGTPAEFRQFIQSQLDYWGTVVKESGMTLPQ